MPENALLHPPQQGVQPPRSQLSPVRCIHTRWTHVRKGSGARDRVPSSHCRWEGLGSNPSERPRGRSWCNLAAHQHNPLSQLSPARPHSYGTPTTRSHVVPRCQSEGSFSIRSWRPAFKSRPPYHTSQGGSVAWYHANPHPRSTLTGKALTHTPRSTGSNWFRAHHRGGGARALLWFRITPVPG